MSGLLLLLARGSKMTSKPQLPTKEMSIAEILERWPETAATFQRLRTACVGCSMASFCTVAEVAAYYQLDAVPLLLGLQGAIEQAMNPDMEAV